MGFFCARFDILFVCFRGLTHELKSFSVKNGDGGIFGGLEFEIFGVFHFGFELDSEIGELVDFFHFDEVLNFFPEDQIDDITIFVLDIDFSEHVFGIDVSGFSNNRKELIFHLIFVDEFDYFLFGHACFLLGCKLDFAGEGLLELDLEFGLDRDFLEDLS